MATWRLPARTVRIGGPLLALAAVAVGGVLVDAGTAGWGRALLLPLVAATWSPLICLAARHVALETAPMPDGRLFLFPGERVMAVRSPGLRLASVFAGMVPLAPCFAFAASANAEPGSSLLGAGLTVLVAAAGLLLTPLMLTRRAGKPAAT